AVIGDLAGLRVDQLEDERTTAQRGRVVQQARKLCLGQTASGAEEVELGRAVLALVIELPASALDHAAGGEPGAPAVVEELDERAVELAEETDADAGLAGEFGEGGQIDVLLAGVVDLDERQRDEAEGVAAVDDALGVELVLGHGGVEGLGGVGQDE